METQYSFMWIFVDSVDRERGWKSRCYKGSLLQCCSKMVNWIAGREIEVDYEALAEHLEEDAPYDERYPDLRNINHVIVDYIAWGWMMEKIGKFTGVEKIDVPTGLKPKWTVRHYLHGYSLGEIFWVDELKCFMFKPDRSPLFDVGCLTAIAAFIEKEAKG